MANGKTTKELRELYTEKKTIYQESVTRANVAQESISKKLAEIDMDFIEKLATEHKIDLRVLQTMDLEKIKVDPEYLGQVQNQLAAGINQLHSYIERCLDV